MHPCPPPPFPPARPWIEPVNPRDGKYYCFKDYNLRGRKIFSYTPDATDTQGRRAACALQCATDPHCTFFVLFADGTCSLRALLLVGRSSGGVTAVMPEPGSESCVLVDWPTSG